MGTRPFKTDYAGAWGGACKTRESAISAAVNHITRDGYTRATITDMRTGESIAWVHLEDGRRNIVITTAKIIRKIGK